VPVEVELSRAARRTLTFIALPGALSIALFHREAAADQAIRADYLAPVGCPEHEEFLERVRQRIPDARAAGPDELARKVSIVVSEDEEGFVARLDFVDVTGETIIRTLTGATCDEVVTGIALVTALALEAQREEDGTPEPPPSPPPQEAPPAAVPPANRDRPPSFVSFEPEDETPPPRWRWAVGIAAGNAWYGAPGLPIAVDVLLRLGRTGRSASARAVARYWLSSTSGDRAATFQGWTGGLEGCPLAWPEGTLKLEPCAALDLGALSARGQRPDLTPQTGTIFWADARIIARARVVLGFVELEAQGELGFPLRRHAFVFDNPRENVWEIPDLGAGWRAGATIHFP
jgi:hypothetical protein